MTHRIVPDIAVPIKSIGGNRVCLGESPQQWVVLPGSVVHEPGVVIELVGVGAIGGELVGVAAGSGYAEWGVGLSCDCPAGDDVDFDGSEVVGDVGGDVVGAAG